MTDDTAKEFEAAVYEAYETTGRSDLWLAANIQCEASEMAELIIKREGYNKDFAVKDLVSEAGDVINFVTALLHTHGCTLEEALEDNTKKLKKRGWIK